MTKDKYITFKPGQPVDVDAEFGVDKVSDNKYVSKKPMYLPTASSKGAYGGNLCGQALLVAMKSAGSEFKPHSIHSYFVRPTLPNLSITWEVEEISNGKTFCNRNIKAIQNNVIVFIASISLTRKNSYKESMDKYNEYYSKIQQKGKDDDSTEEDEDDDSSTAPVKPFVFQTPQHEWLTRSKEELENLPIRDIESSMLVYIKFVPEFIELNKTKSEDSLTVPDRKLSFLVKWGIENEQGFNQPLTNLTPEYQFVGLAFLSDSLFLNSLTRILRIEDFQVNNHTASFDSVSLDHIVYFHDDDFDVRQWMGYSFKAIRFAHNRVVVEGEIFNEKGTHIATIIQEALVELNGTEKGAKL
ncbi:unnamed protein product [Candida verbasci]|uniref:Uncharacterized protein n=1 Tax=Candida verbasci TaxID=1227364 RepID=A0A9W4TTU6_9ASCO|nr:unnamed protein product [Candida verbasci]